MTEYYTAKYYLLDDDGNTISLHETRQHASKARRDYLDKQKIYDQAVRDKYKVYTRYWRIK